MQSEVKSGGENMQWIRKVVGKICNDRPKMTWKICEMIDLAHIM